MANIETIFVLQAEKKQGYSMQKENHDRTLTFTRQKSVLAEDNVNVLY
ncbi:hypothetical protein HMPREF1990_01129 [Porphyromonas gingivalis W4087]|nr:hypothetical protein HMPREF1990_01129 [Porphyromonas gingivalis W4087]